MYSLVSIGDSNYTGAKCSQSPTICRQSEHLTIRSYNLFEPVIIIIEINNEEIIKIRHCNVLRYMQLKTVLYAYKNKVENKNRTIIDVKYNIGKIITLPSGSSCCQTMRLKTVGYGY